MVELAQKRLNYLNSITQVLRERLSTAPEGKLIVRKNSFLYLRIDGKEYYVSSQNAGPYALKRYHTYALKMADREISALKQYLKSMPGVRLEDAFAAMPDVIKPLITPVLMTDEEYARRWLEDRYIPKGFDPQDTTEFYTKKGERVRSKSEVLIANALFDLGIPYKYERPLAIYDGNLIIHPDFTILNVRTRKEFYLEHCGKMDDPAYAEKFVQRLKYYTDNGIFFGDKLLFTCETSDMPLSTRDLLSILKHHFL